MPCTMTGMSNAGDMIPAGHQSAAPFVLVAPGRVVGGMLTARF